MSTLINFSTLWLRSLDRKYYTWKNHEAQSLENETFKVEIEKKNYKINHKNKKIMIKRIRLKSK
jgi:uncharacterized surface protein with fasciclin (FAS1) repeats